MKFVALFLVVVLLAVSVFAAPASDGEESLEVRKCVPGKIYFDGCNNCSCSPNGVQICTLKACPERLANGTVIYLGNDPAPDDFWQKNQ